MSRFAIHHTDGKWLLRIADGFDATVVRVDLQELIDLGDAALAALQGSEEVPTEERIRSLVERFDADPAWEASTTSSSWIWRSTTGGVAVFGRGWTPGIAEELDRAEAAYARHLAGEVDR